MLPIVDSARELDGRGAAQFVSDSGWELAAAALTFLVVGVFWRTHHGVFADATGATHRAVTYNLFWLACVAFLPVPTVLIVDAQSDDRGAHGLYVGTMLVAVVALVLEELELQRHGLLADDEVPQVSRWATAGGFALAFVLVLVFPSWSMWPLLVLVPAGWLPRWLQARARRSGG